MYNFYCILIRSDRCDGNAAFLYFIRVSSFEAWVQLYPCPITTMTAHMYGAAKPVISYCVIISAAIIVHNRIKMSAVFGLTFLRIAQTKPEPYILLPQLNLANNTCQIENFSASESLTICQHFTKFLIWIEMQMPLGYTSIPAAFFLDKFPLCLRLFSNL